MGDQKSEAAAGAGESIPPETHEESATAWASRVGWRAVPAALVLGVLMCRAWFARQTRFEPVHWTELTPEAIRSWFRVLWGRELTVLVLFFLLGLLTPLAFSSIGHLAPRFRRWVTWLAWLVLNLFVVGLSLMVTWRRVPSLGLMALPLAVSWAGVGLGAAALRGRRCLLWSVGSVGVVGLVLVGLGALLVPRLLASQPLAYDTRAMNREEKVALARKIRASRGGEGESRSLRLTDADLNALLHSLSRRVDLRQQASIHFGPSSLSAQSSWALRRSPPRRYLNIRLQSQLEVQRGELVLVPEEFSVGGLSLPRPVLSLLGHSLHAMLLEDPQMRTMLQSIEKLRLERGSMDVAVRPGLVSRQFIPSLANLLWQRPDVSMESREYVSHLLSLREGLPQGDEGFARLLESALTLASQRSVKGDPQLENRAAVFALAILWGHRDLEPFVGEVLDADQRALADRAAGTITLHGRSDLPRHFLVSAALLLMADEATSDLIGTLKEKIDAQEGGSGFSFVDVAANMAGNRFAELATRDSATARAVQLEMGRDMDLAWLFPSFDDLPENIPASEFQSRYGGLNGAGSREWMAEIRRRLDALPDRFP